MHSSLSSSIVQMLFDFVEHRGMDAPSVLGAPRPVDATGLSQVPGVQWMQMLDRLQRTFPEPALGLAVCRLAAPKYGGVLAYLTQHSSTLGEAIWHLFKYERLLHNLNTGRHTIRPTGIHLRWRADRCSTNQLNDELLIGGLLAYIRLITDSPTLPVRRISFLYPAPPDPRPYQEFFGCLVEFSQPMAGIELPISSMLLNIRHHDDALQELLEHQAKAALQKLLALDQYIANVQTVIAALLPLGGPSAANCARRLGISTRTLQRQLEMRQTCFKQLLDETRRDFAESLLLNPTHSLVDVALRLGYADQAAFTRAFARWTGEPPAKWRKLRMAVKMAEDPEHAPGLDA